MQVITFNRPTAAPPFHYAPNTRYLINEAAVNRMIQDDPTIEYHNSNYNAYEKKYAGQELNGKRLLVYRPRSVGDQLITTALIAYLKDRWPKSVIDYYCDPYVAPLWDGIPIFISPTPISFDGAKRYDYTLFLEGLYENDKEPDQDDCYTSMFRYAGFPEVDPKWKKPHMRFRPEELERPKNAPEKYVLVQWESSAVYRSYPPRQLADVCTRLSKHIPVVIVGQFPYPYVHGPNVIDLRQKTPFFRSLVPWVANASAILCPDSSIGHLAACFPKVPTVSLWGSYHPRVRVAHYSNHIPLMAEKVCPFSPCYHGLQKEPPRSGCVKASNDDPTYQVCNQIKAIPEELIVKTLLDHANQSPFAFLAK